MKQDGAVKEGKRHGLAKRKRTAGIPSNVPEPSKKRRILSNRCIKSVSTPKSVSTCSVSQSRIVSQSDTGSSGETDMELESDAAADCAKDMTLHGNEMPSSVNHSAASNEETPTSRPTPPRMSVNNVDLIFVPLQDKLMCRLCLSRHDRSPTRSPRSSSFPTLTLKPIPAIFPRGATCHELALHCEREHPAACEEMIAMNAGEIMELRLRMMGVGCGVHVGR